MKHLFIYFLLHGFQGLSFLKVKVAQACPALCNPMNYTVHGILQARILEWKTKQKQKQKKNAGVGSLSVL